MTAKTKQQEAKKTWLNRGYRLRIYIEALEELKQQKKANAEYSGINYGKNCSVRTNSNTTEKKIDEVLASDTEIDKLKKRLERVESEIESAIENVSSEKRRTVLKKHYIECKTFKEISREMYYSESNIKVIHKQALDTLNIDPWTY